MSEADSRPIFTARTFHGAACYNATLMCKLSIKKQALWTLQRRLEHTAKGTTAKKLEDVKLLTFASGNLVY